MKKLIQFCLVAFLSVLAIQVTAQTEPKPASKEVQKTPPSKKIAKKANIKAKPVKAKAETPAKKI